MTSSGTLDTTKLLLAPNQTGWGGTGIEHNGVGDIDIMGGTAFGQVNIGYTFHAGTNASAITNPGGPFSMSNFSWTINSGSKSFTTYSGFNSSFTQRIPGIGLVASDIVGGLWSPDQTWTEYGVTFASLGLNAGTYSVSDIETKETITIQVGKRSVDHVPDASATLALLGGSLFGLAVLRRRFAS